MSEWISVKERLPKVSEDVWVWVTYKKGRMRGATYSCGCESFLQTDGTWAMGSAKDFVISHWRYLPEPPNVN